MDGIGYMRATSIANRCLVLVSLASNASKACLDDLGSSFCASGAGLGALGFSLCASGVGLGAMGLIHVPRMHVLFHCVEGWSR